MMRETQADQMRLFRFQNPEEFGTILVKRQFFVPQSNERQWKSHLTNGSLNVAMKISA